MMAGHGDNGSTNDNAVVGNSIADDGAAVSTATNECDATTMNSGNDDDGDGAASKKMFFTTSDLITRMNTAIKDANPDGPPLPNANPDGGFELQRKMPDGSYRRAEESETAAADFQAKMKQASEMISVLNSEEKIEWARCQRKEGNKLFANGEYKEAMDVYLTCLVAMDGQNSNQTTSSSEKEEDSTSTPTATATEDSSEPNETENEQQRLKNQILETEIKLPVLLNLSLAALKLGMLSKSEKFCNFAMEMESGRQSPKAYFRRGRVRMLMGHYVSAELDLDKALELVECKIDEMMVTPELGDEDNNVGDDCGLSSSLKEAKSERAVILREKQKLNRLTNQAEKNERQQKKAMEKLFKSKSLYPEKKGPEQQTTNVEPSTAITSIHEGHESEEYQPTTYFQWYLQMIGRCAQKLLDIIGDGEEDENELVDVPVDQELLKKLMEEKKHA